MNAKTRRLTGAGLAAIGLAGFALNVQAAVIVEQPLPPEWGVTDQGGWCSPCDYDGQGNPDFRVFASFSLAAAATVRGGRFPIHDITPGDDDLNISIWDVPFGTELFSVTVPGNAYARQHLSIADHFVATVDLPGWLLGPGDYWLGVFGANGNGFGWGPVRDGGDDQQYDYIEGVWQIASRERNVAFTLYDDSGSVPEPGSLALLGLGLAGLGFARRRRAN